MHTRRLLTGFLVCSLLLASACSYFSPTTPNSGQDGGLRTLVIPDDAEVFVDGSSMGPVSGFRGRTFIPMKGGQHVVEIKKPGYQTYRHEVTINNNIITITVTLKKEGVN